MAVILGWVTMEGEEAILGLITFLGAGIALACHTGPRICRLDSPLLHELGFRLVIPVAVLLIVLPTLLHWADPEVRGDAGYVVLLLGLGFEWVTMCVLQSVWLGIGWFDDAVERRNPAAKLVLIGATLGFACMYAGANTGTGPSLWNNVFSAIVGTLGLFAAWLMVELLGRPSLAVTEERDVATGIRLGGWLLSVGLIAGRAVAGNWHSMSATVSDFLNEGWPLLPLALVAAVLEVMFRPGKQMPFPPWRIYGVIPVAAYLLAAALWLVHLGGWEGMK